MSSVNFYVFEIFVQLIMKCFCRVFSCGRSSKLTQTGNNPKQDASRMVSEVTQAGESSGETRFSAYPSKLDESVVSVKKKKGEKLGIRLFPGTTRIQSIEADSVLSRKRYGIPVNSRICLVNTVIATDQNIRDILRECLDRTSVSITFSSEKGMVGSTRGSLKENITPRSCSAQSGSSVPRQSIDQGVVMIDFNKLSRDSIQMWTRNPSRNASLPVPQVSWHDDDDCDFSGERKSSKRSSCEGLYNYSSGRIS